MAEEKTFKEIQIAPEEQAPSRVETTSIINLKSYETMQGVFSNSVSLISEKNIMSRHPTDPLANSEIVYHKGKVTYTFKLTKSGKVGLSPLALEVLQFIFINVAQKGLESEYIQLSILQYLNLKQKLNTPENYKQAKKDIKEGMLELMAVFFTYENKGKKKIPPTEMGILANRYISNCEGFLGAYLQKEFFNLLKDEGSGVLPAIYFLVDKRKHPYSAMLSRLLMNHKETNLGKPNEHILSIRTIAKELGLMSEEEAKKRRRVKELVIDVIERDLEPLTEELTQLTWHYCRKNNTPLTKEEQKKLSTVYYSLDLWYDFPDTPEQTEKRNKILERAKEREKKIEKEKLKREVDKALGKVANKPKKQAKS